MQLWPLKTNMNRPRTCGMFLWKWGPCLPAFMFRTCFSNSNPKKCRLYLSHALFGSALKCLDSVWIKLSKPSNPLQRCLGNAVGPHVDFLGQGRPILPQWLMRVVGWHVSFKNKLHLWPIKSPLISWFGDIHLHVGIDMHPPILLTGSSWAYWICKSQGSEN